MLITLVVNTVSRIKKKFIRTNNYKYIEMFVLVVQYLWYEYRLGNDTSIILNSMNNIVH